MSPSGRVAMPGALPTSWPPTPARSFPRSRTHAPIVPPNRLAGRGAPRSRGGRRLQLEARGQRGNPSLEPLAATKLPEQPKKAPRSIRANHPPPEGRRAHREAAALDPRPPRVARAPAPTRLRRGEEPPGGTRATAPARSTTTPPHGRRAPRRPGLRRISPPPRRQTEQRGETGPAAARATRA